MPIDPARRRPGPSAYRPRGPDEGVSNPFSRAACGPRPRREGKQAASPGPWIKTGLAAVLALAVSATARGGEPATADPGPPPAVDVETAYADAAQQLRLADAAVVRARQQAVAACRSASPYAGAAAALDAAFDAYAERRNALLTAADQHDGRFATDRKGAADPDPEVARGFLKQLTALEDDAVNRDADAKRLRQAWEAAAARVADLQDRQPATAEAAPAVRAAVASAAAARAAADRARSALPGPTDGVEPSAAELARRYPRHGLDGDDAWLAFAAATRPAAGGK